MALRMRQSLADPERAFVEEAWEERDRREALRQAAAHRSRRRRLERQHKRGSWRFAVLVLMLIATAAGVTVAMFETLYLILGWRARGARRASRAERPRISTPRRRQRRHQPVYCCPSF